MWAGVKVNDCINYTLTSLQRGISVLYVDQIFEITLKQMRYEFRSSRENRYLTHQKTCVLFVPPSGHVAGIYARNDSERGVPEAPVSEIIRGSFGWGYNVTNEEHKILNSKGVPCIRAIQGQGIRVMGSRTASSGRQWSYVNIRQLFMYIKESIEKATQWAVFLTNGEKMYAKVRQNITIFLIIIRNGLLICIIEIAPVKSSEFFFALFIKIDLMILKLR
jgi:phage tail sheath protein FI